MLKITTKNKVAFVLQFVGRPMSLMNAITRISKLCFFFKFKVNFGV